jgi:hypothetical protein
VCGACRAVSLQCAMARHAQIASMSHIVESWPLWPMSSSYKAIKNPKKGVKQFSLTNPLSCALFFVHRSCSLQQVKV